MIVIEQLTVQHAKTMSLQKAQVSNKSLLLSDEYIQSMIDTGPAYALVDSGMPLILAGVSIYWKGRGFGWAIISEFSGPYMKRITKEVKRFLDESDIKRIETAVDCRFEAGQKWAKMLGLKFEGRMEAWGPNGDDFDLYSRVKKWPQQA